MNKFQLKSLLIIAIVIFMVMGFRYKSRAGKKMMPSSNQKPNVVMIILDDMKDWVGYLGGYEGEVHTPAIDRLAAEGMGFTNAHVASPQSCPSRNALLLGKRPSTTGLYDNNSWWKTDFPDMVTLPQYFRNNDYYVAGAGKIFHHTPGNNPPVSWDNFQDQVFDDPWNFATWSPEKYFLDYGYRGPKLPLPSWKPLNEIDGLDTQMDWGPIPGKPDQEYGDVMVVNYARKFLKNKYDKPFFLALGIYKPHIPWHVPKKYFDMYPLNEIVLPETRDDDLEDLPEAGKMMALKHSKDYRTIKKAGKYKEAVQAYLASISFADAMVGEILDALESSGYGENTIVILLSDHGWHLGSKQTWHKFTLWEECTRIPFVVKVPGMTKPGSRCDQPVDMMNIYPTLISLCGLPPKKDVEGHDMSGLLADPKAQWKWPAITEYMAGEVAIRTKDWRYIRYPDGGEELYDRKNDPNEWENLAEEVKYKQIIDQHRKWIPDNFAKPASNKNEWFFDPCEYTFMNRESGEFIDGKK